MTNKLPTLYKEKNGKIQFWRIYTTTENGTPKYVQEHGYVGGKTQSTGTFVKSGKSIGRANETTAQQQCELQAKSLWTKQIERKGYVENLKDNHGFRPVSPMLAHSANEYPHKIVLPCYVQKKYDGICCLAHINNLGETRFFSRRANEWNTLGHLFDEVKRIGIKNIVLHGELYTHGVKFEDITSGVKRDEASDKSGIIEYIVYDAAIPGTYEQRLGTLSSLLKPEWNKTSKIRVATTYMANTHEQIEAWHDAFVKDGYEGAILRNPQGVYVKDKRSFDLLKYKKFKDGEFEIVGVKENNKGIWAGTCVFVLKTKEGYEFESMPEGSKEERLALYNAWKYGKIKPGMIGSIRYFRFTETEKPVPKMSTFLRVRDYE